MNRVKLGAGSKAVTTPEEAMIVFVATGAETA